MVAGNIYLKKSKQGKTLSLRYWLMLRQKVKKRSLFQGI